MKKTLSILLLLVLVMGLLAGCRSGTETDNQNGGEQNSGMNGEIAPNNVPEGNNDAQMLPDPAENGRSRYPSANMG